VSGRSLEFDFSTPPPPSAPSPTSPAATPPSNAPRSPIAKKEILDPPRAFSVGELARGIKQSLDLEFAEAVWVEGEVTGARPASSGHLYFCLKDEREDASIDVAMYKTSITPRARALIKDGAKIRLRGKPTFWAPRGRLQFIADRADAVGKGALLEALEKLKEKLLAEGLFADERKRALPNEPRAIGVVSSASGAVIHDICKVAFRRGGARVLLAPAIVQGANAAESICRAIALLQRVHDVDVIIVARGGGSSDDLACFNEEAVVRAIAACTVPVVSAVGHEVDVTLTDFVADRRAATPSQAAELVVPDSLARRDLLRERNVRLVRAMRAKITESRIVRADLARGVGDPRLAIASHQQSLDDANSRLEASARIAITRRRDPLSRLHSRLAALHPRTILSRERAELLRVDDRLRHHIRVVLTKRASVIESFAARLDAMSPLKVLGRGYSIATREDGRAIRDASDVAVGDRIHIRADRVMLEATIDKSTPRDKS
jgi:exodeoxyribonuclease VII large subunit